MPQVQDAQAVQEDQEDQEVQLDQEVQQDQEVLAMGVVAGAAQAAVGSWFFNF